MQKLLVIFLSLILVSSRAAGKVSAQIIGGSSPSDKYIYGTISDTSGKPLFGALLTLYGPGGNTSTQKSNSGGEFGFIKKTGTYSLYGSILGYQSNMCHFTVTTHPVLVTFNLARLGTGPSSCEAFEQTSDPTIAPIATPVIGDGTQGPSDGGVDTSVTSPSNPSTNTGGSTSSDAVVNSDGTITSRSNCVVTKIGNPSGEATLPADCNLSSPDNPSVGGGGVPGSCGPAPDVTFTSAEQYENAINTKFGIIFQGFSLDQMQQVWLEFHRIACTGLLNDIRGTTLGRWGYAYSQQFSCPGERIITDDNPGGYNVDIGEHHGDFVKALITHELTHVWQKCSTRGEQNRLEIPTVYDSEGGLTNYSRSGCKFNVNLLNEDHADTIALYLNPDVGELTCGGGAPNPFANGGFPRHNALAKRGTGR